MVTFDIYEGMIFYKLKKIAILSNSEDIHFVLIDLFVFCVLQP